MLRVKFYLDSFLIEVFFLDDDSLCYVDRDNLDS